MCNTKFDRNLLNISEMKRADRQTDRQTNKHIATTFPCKPMSLSYDFHEKNAVNGQRLDCVTIYLNALYSFQDVFNRHSDKFTFRPSFNFYHIGTVQKKSFVKTPHFLE